MANPFFPHPNQKTDTAPATAAPNDGQTAPPDRLLTAREVADLLAVPESWVREATRDGRLPHLKLGRYRRYQHRAIQAWLNDQQAGPTPKAGQRTCNQAARERLIKP